MVRLRRYSNWALKGLDRALPLSMAVPEVITFCTEEIRVIVFPFSFFLYLSLCSQEEQSGS